MWHATTRPVAGITFGKERIETQDELAMALEELLHALDDAGSVDPASSSVREGPQAAICRPMAISTHDQAKIVALPA